MISCNGGEIIVEVPKNEMTMIKCICASCPSYTKCMDSGNLGVFCSIGDAKKCLQDLEGCKCQEDCSVSSEYNFSSQYHCNEGSANQQQM